MVLGRYLIVGYLGPYINFPMKIMFVFAGPQIKPNAGSRHVRPTVAFQRSQIFQTPLIQEWFSNPIYLGNVQTTNCKGIQRMFYGTFFN